jgi:hypothetical protein
VVVEAEAEVEVVAEAAGEAEVKAVVAAPRGEYNGERKSFSVVPQGLLLKQFSIHRSLSKLYLRVGMKPNGSLSAKQVGKTRSIVSAAVALQCGCCSKDNSVLRLTHSWCWRRTL